MAADPGRAVLEGIEALGVPKFHVFLLRLGIDGRGLDPDHLCDIAVEALRLRPRLVESAWLRGQAGALVSARSGVLGGPQRVGIFGENLPHFMTIQACRLSAKFCTAFRILINRSPKQRVQLDIWRLLINLSLNSRSHCRIHYCPRPL